MRAVAPASTSNLGPGFDVLGLALCCYVEVELSEAPRLSVRAEGEGADLPADASHLGARVAADVLGHDRFALVVRSQIPVGRGLGSSAALAVAAAAAAGSPDPLGVAARFDGHPENAAASVLGGLVAATFVDGVPVARLLALDAGLTFVAVVPDRTLSTEQARAALPSTVAFGDATFNLGRLGLLLAGLASRSQLVTAAGEDRLHQDARAALFPEADLVMARLRAGGATVACWSGAGPTVLGICTDETRADAARDAGEAALGEAGLTGSARVLRADRDGLVVSAS